jgi:methyl-accepting chemotaxis protein
MAQAAEGIARGAQEQARAVQNTSSLIGEMAGIVDQVSDVTGSVTGANAKVTEAARHGVGAVEQTGQGMDTIRIRAATTAEKVKEMSSRSKEIGRIVETIDDIADKTDMLALNAAVEAARAGEHGRGFAVVAEQVRKLSEDSKGATRDINQLIERVQESISEAITAMEGTVAEVDNGSRLAEDTSQSLQEILQAAEGAADLAGQIDLAVAQLKQKNEGVVAAIESVSTVVEENTAVAEEMAANSQEVSEAMEGVASIAEENSASAEEVSASAEEMSAQVEEVVASAEELSALAEQLQSAAALFQVEQTTQVPPERLRSAPESVGVPAGRQQPQPALAGDGHQSNGHRTEPK